MQNPRLVDWPLQRVVTDWVLELVVVELAAAAAVVVKESFVEQVVAAVDYLL